MANSKTKLIPTWMLILVLYYISTNTDTFTAGITTTVTNDSNDKYNTNNYM